MTTPKEKKEYAALGVLLLAIILVLYFSFFRKSAPAPILSSPVPGPAGSATVPSAGPAAAADAALSGSAPAAAAPLSASGSVQNFLPNGSVLNLKLLQDSRFKALVAPNYPTVTKDEIGVVDPFASGQ